MSRLVLILALLLAFRPSMADQKSAPSTRFVDKAMDYSFQPPQGWIKIESLPRPMTAFKEVVKEGFATNFYVNFHGLPVEPAQEQKFLKEIEKAYKTQGKMTPIVPTKLGGKTAYTWRVVLNIANAKGIETRQVLCFYKRRAYELTFTNPVAQHKRCDAIFDKILASFQFAK